MAKSIILVIVCLASVAIGNYPQEPRSKYYYEIGDNGLVGYSQGCLPCCNEYNFHFNTRIQWGAKRPTSVTKLPITPVPFVVIHHTYSPTVCTTKAQCVAAMKAMQRNHMITNKWADIGYNFAVGGEGAVYEGRGWKKVGAHAIGYNKQSIGIALIGNFEADLPGNKQLQTVKDLIAAGVDLGYIRGDYALIGHRQASVTRCPGDALFREIQGWDNYSTIQL